MSRGCERGCNPCTADAKGYCPQTPPPLWPGYATPPTPAPAQARRPAESVPGARTGARPRLVELLSGYIIHDEQDPRSRPARFHFNAYVRSSSSDGPRGGGEEAQTIIEAGPDFLDHFRRAVCQADAFNRDVVIDSLLSVDESHDLRHIPMVDCIGEDVRSIIKRIRELEVPDERTGKRILRDAGQMLLVDSGRSLHVYGRRPVTLETWVDFTRALRLTPQVFDRGWVDASLDAGYGSLRLTCRDPEYRKEPTPLGLLQDVEALIAAGALCDGPRGEDPNLPWPKKVELLTCPITHWPHQSVQEVEF